MMATRIQEVRQRLLAIARDVSGKPLRLTIVIMASGLLLITLIIGTAPANSPKEPQEKAWSVSVMTARPGAVSPELLLFGRIETPRTATLSVSSVAVGSAGVARVWVKEGQWVSDGQLLVSLEDRDAHLEVTRREAELANARAMLASARVKHDVDERALARQRRVDELTRDKLERQQQLHARDMLADASLDEARREAQLQSIALGEIEGRVADHENELERHRGDVTLAEAQLEQALLNLERTEILAPFPGRIAAVAVARGERIAPGAPVAEIYDTSTLEVRAQIPSQHAAKLRRALEQSQGVGGTPVIAHVRLDETDVVLHLDRLAGRVAKGRGGIDALFSVTREIRSLELGRVVDVFVELPPEAGVVAVPIQAIHGDARIYTVVDNRLHEVDIDRIGVRQTPGGGYEVLVRGAGLASGDAILVTHLPEAIDGLKVKLSESQQAVVP